MAFSSMKGELFLHLKKQTYLSVAACSYLSSNALSLAVSKPGGRFLCLRSCPPEVLSMKLQGLAMGATISGCLLLHFTMFSKAVRTELRLIQANFLSKTGNCDMVAYQSVLT